MYCKNCKLIYGNKRAADNWGTAKDILILRSTPTAAECTSGNIKYSKANKILIASMKTYGFENKYYVSNILNCYPRINYGMTEVNACLPKLTDIFNLHDFKIVLTSGLLAYQTMTNYYHIKDIHSIVNNVITIGDIIVIPTYSYLQLAKNPKLYDKYVTSLTTLVDIYRTKININHKTKIR
jgi:uracil-DNA glycosylase family 4